MPAGFQCGRFSVCQINICSPLEGSKSSDSLFKLLDEMTAVEILMTVEYCCAVVANRVFSALPPPFIAFSGSAKCSEPRPHPVHTQTGGAGERLRHTSVSRWVCCVCHALTWRNGSPIHFWGWDAFQVVVSYLSSDFCGVLPVWRLRWLVYVGTNYSSFTACTQSILIVIQWRKR